MKQITGYRRVASIGTSLGIYVSSLIKDSGIKAGDVVKITIEVDSDENKGDERDRFRIQMQHMRSQG